jgi:hypothetical protein
MKSIYNEGGRYPMRHQGETAAVKRAMLEMGFNPGNELRLPPQEILDEKGMTQEEFMDAVYERAGDLYSRPMETIGAGSIDSGYREPGLMYNNGGRFGDPLKRAMRQARRQSRRRDNSILKEELDRRYQEIGASQMMEEMAGIYPSRVAEFNEWYEENLPTIKEMAYQEELKRRGRRDRQRGWQNKYNERLRKRVGTGDMLNMLSDYFQR